MCRLLLAHLLSAACCLLPSQSLTHTCCPCLPCPQVTDPYLKLFSGLVPPLLGSIDLTPLFGFFILQFLAGALDVADDETRYW